MTAGMALSDRPYWTRKRDAEPVLRNRPRSRRPTPPPRRAAAIAPQSVEQKRRRSRDRKRGGGERRAQRDPGGGGRAGRLAGRGSERNARRAARDAAARHGHAHAHSRRPKHPQSGAVTAKRRRRVHRLPHRERPLLPHQRHLLRHAWARRKHTLDGSSWRAALSPAPSAARPAAELARCGETPCGWTRIAVYHVSDECACLCRGSAPDDARRKRRRRSACPAPPAEPTPSSTAGRGARARKSCSSRPRK